MEMSEYLTAHGAVVSDPTTLELFDQIRDLGSHTSLGYPREHHGVFLTGDEHLDHRPARLGPHARRDRRQLEPGVLEELLQALDLLATSPDLGLAVAGQLPQTPNLRSRHNADRKRGV